MTNKPLKSLAIYKGNDWEQRLQVVDDDGNNPDISAYGIVFSINDQYDENPLSAIIQKANVTGGGTNTEINMASATNGIYKIIIDDIDTSAINSGDYYYDVKFIVGSLEYTQKVGIFRINQVVNIH